MEICPKCGNGTSDEIFKKTGKCYWCGNADFSEEAQKLKDYPYKTVNCSCCGKLQKIDDVTMINPTFYSIPKEVKIDPDGWVYLCSVCEPKIKLKNIPIEKVLPRLKVFDGKNIKPLFEKKN